MAGQLTRLLAVQEYSNTPKRSEFVSANYSFLSATALRAFPSDFSTTIRIPTKWVNFSQTFLFTAMYLHAHLCRLPGRSLEEVLRETQLDHPANAKIALI
jgi:hypothetical protein